MACCVNMVRPSQPICICLFVFRYCDNNSIGERVGGRDLVLNKENHQRNKTCEVGIMLCKGRGDKKHMLGMLNKEQVSV